MSTRNRCRPPQGKEATLACGGAAAPSSTATVLIVFMGAMAGRSNLPERVPTRYLVAARSPFYCVILSASPLGGASRWAGPQSVNPSASLISYSPYLSDLERTGPDAGHRHPVTAPKVATNLGLFVGGAVAHRRSISRSRAGVLA
jgi:hypothetical protein